MHKAGEFGLHRVKGCEGRLGCTSWRDADNVGGPQMNCGGVCREWGCTIGVTPPVCVCEAGGDRTLPCGTEPRDMGRATPIPTGVQPCPYWGAEGFSCAPPPPFPCQGSPCPHQGGGSTATGPASSKQPEIPLGKGLRAAACACPPPRQSRHGEGGGPIRDGNGFRVRMVGGLVECSGGDGQEREVLVSRWAPRWCFGNPRTQPSSFPSSRRASSAKP